MKNEEYELAVEKLRQRFGHDEEGFEREMARVRWVESFISPDGDIAEIEHPYWFTICGRTRREDWVRDSTILAGNDPVLTDPVFLDPWSHPDEAEYDLMPHIPFVVDEPEPLSKAWIQTLVEDTVSRALKEAVEAYNRDDSDDLDDWDDLTARVDAVGLI